LIIAGKVRLDPPELSDHRRDLDQVGPGPGSGAGTDPFTRPVDSPRSRLRCGDEATRLTGSTTTSIRHRSRQRENDQLRSAENSLASSVGVIRASQSRQPSANSSKSSSRTASHQVQVEPASAAPGPASRRAEPADPLVRADHIQDALE